MQGSRLVLIDGMAIVYRSYFAIRSLNRSDGTPTNALYGFVRTVSQIRRLLAPTHMLVAFDGGTPAHRLRLVPGYKAQRPPMPDDMRVQLPLIRDFLHAAGLVQCRLDACEADDIIATAVECSRDAVDAQVIVSGDKDLFQLVTAAVQISRSGSDQDLMGPGAVRAKTGVSPEQVPAWLALTGDHADNIPGVPGVGPKTAARLLREHGSLEALWSALSGPPAGGRLAGLLLDHRERVQQNLEAVRLIRDLAGVPALADLQLADAGPVAPLLEFYDAMEFHQLAGQLREPQFDL